MIDHMNGKLEPVPRGCIDDWARQVENVKIEERRPNHGWDIPTYLVASGEKLQLSTNPYVDYYLPVPAPTEKRELLTLQMEFHTRLRDRFARAFSLLKEISLGLRRGQWFDWIEEKLGPPPLEADPVDPTTALATLKERHARHAARVAELEAEYAQLPEILAEREAAARKLEAQRMEGMHRAMHRAQLQDTIHAMEL
jgi:hypothetical protein